MPSTEEIDAAANNAELVINADVPPEPYKNIREIIKSSRVPKNPGDKEINLVPSVYAVYMEWLLLQCVCDQAQRKLMEAVYLHLTKTAEDPA